MNETAYKEIDGKLTKTCNNCQYLKVARRAHYRFELCDNPQFAFIDPVKGVQKKSCEKTRDDGRLCGPEAIGFSPRKSVLVKFLELIVGAKSNG